MTNFDRADNVIEIKEVIDRARMKKLRQQIGKDLIKYHNIDGVIKKYKDNEFVQANGDVELIQKIFEELMSPKLPGKHEREPYIIDTLENNLDDYWRNVERTALKKKLPIYLNGDQLVWPRWQWHYNRKHKTYSLFIELEPYTHLSLADMIDRHAIQFKKKVVKQNGEVKYKDIGCPLSITRRWLQLKNYSSQTPRITGAITSITMRPDLSMLTKPGYDEDTGLYLKPSWFDVDLPDMKEKPTREDAEQALAQLNEVFDEFAFDGEMAIRKRNEQAEKIGKPLEELKSVARSGALAATMTTTARGALTGLAVPLFLVNAPYARTGKGTLIRVIVHIATGLPPSSDDGEEDKDEFRKRIETAIGKGRQILYLENLANGMTIKSRLLARISTDQIISIRKMGTNDQQIKCDCSAMTVFLDGNNIKVGTTDLIVRTITIRLNANMPKPEERKFNRTPEELMDIVRKNRGKYVAAVFTILRAFAEAGFPRPPEGKWKKVNGFEEWEKLIQWALIWLGQPDPRGAMDKAREEDDTSSDIGLLISALLQKSEPATDTRDWFTTKDAANLANKRSRDNVIWINRDIRDLMMDKRGNVNGNILADLIAKCSDQFYNGSQFIKLKGKDHNAVKYCLVHENGEKRILKRDHDDDDDVY